MRFDKHERGCLITKHRTLIARDARSCAHETAKLQTATACTKQSGRNLFLRPPLDRSSRRGAPCGGDRLSRDNGYNAVVVNPVPTLAGSRSGWVGGYSADPHESACASRVSYHSSLALVVDASRNTGDTYAVRHNRGYEASASFVRV